MLWILIATMTAAAVLAVLWPLIRRAKNTRSGSDIEVYRDQLDEIERDLKFGQIGAAEAEAARIEVSRRLIAAAESAGTIEFPHDDAAARRQGRRSRKKPSRRRAAAKQPSRHLRIVVGTAAVMLISVGTFFVYLKVGSPNLPGQPIAARVAEAQRKDPSVQQLAVLEKRTSEAPDDGIAWEAIAPIYSQVGRYGDAVTARRNALRLLDKTAEREADLGEALVTAANGIVTEEAKEAFHRSFRRDGANVSARFYIGLAAEQEGRKDEAARVWRELLADSPPEAPWRLLVQTALARVEPAASLVRKSGSNDSAGAVANAAPEQREKMIRGMVDRLVVRLRQDGSDVDGWIQLVRSYVVLDEKEKPLAAIADARRSLSAAPDKLRRLDEAAKRLVE
ncbi:MAG TPA: c-type cytochrome biogenesis protein CcmI [Bradyrhizobium sp.]